MIAELQPRAVINAAAYTSVDAAERDPAARWAVNSQGVQYLAESCCRLGSALVQISSDYVFGADRDRDLPYSETDLPGPENVYASSKLGGEYWAKPAPAPDYSDVRTVWPCRAAAASSARCCG